MLNDEEHVKLLLKAQEGQDKQPWAPPMATWSPELEQLVTLTDAVRTVQVTLSRVNGGKGEFKPSPRPVTMMDKVRRQLRRLAHQELVRRVLPREQEDG